MCQKWNIDYVLHEVWGESDNYVLVLLGSVDLNAITGSCLETSVLISFASRDH